MAEDVELSAYFDLMTVFCVLSKICRNSTASNCRLASPIFSRWLNCELPASCSGWISEASTFRWSEVISMSAQNQFGLQRAGLFHGLEDRHHVARRDAQRIERGRDSFHGGRLRQRDERGFLFDHVGGGARRHDGATLGAEGGRLRNVERRSDVDGDVAVRDGAARNLDAGRGHDGAGAFV